MSTNEPRPQWWPDGWPWPFEPSTEVEFVDEYDCPRCQGSGEVTTADYESYFGQNYKPCPMCGGGLCLSGKIEFHLADDFNGAGPEEFSVLGAYRIGRKEETQLEGLQGHARIINADMDCSE